MASLAQIPPLAPCFPCVRLPPQAEGRKGLILSFPLKISRSFLLQNLLHVYKSNSPSNG